MKKTAISAVVLALAAGSAFAGAPRETTTLAWPRADQQLTYRSCGCADSCWIAELRERRTKRLQARLRCDCERLLFSRAPFFEETTLPQACNAINSADDKSKAIAAQMRQQLDAVDARPHTARPVPQPGPATGRPIGAATMLKDGTVLLDLRAETGEAVGHAQLEYRRDDPRYWEILRHVGGLRPGQHKDVPPFPGSSTQ